MSLTDKDYLSRNDKDESIENIKSINNKNSHDEYKEEIFPHQHDNESDIKKQRNRKH